MTKRVVNLTQTQKLWQKFYNTGRSCFTWFLFAWFCFNTTWKFTNQFVITNLMHVLFCNLGNYIITSTCFGYHNVHHQEVSIVHAPSGVSLWNNIVVLKYYLICNKSARVMCIKLVITNWLISWCTVREI
jgi:hypothetical protein